MTIDYLDLHSQVMRRVFFVSMLRRLSEPFVGSMFVFGTTLLALFSFVSMFDVISNAWHMPTMYHVGRYVVTAALGTELVVQTVLVAFLVAGGYLAVHGFRRGMGMLVRGAFSLVRMSRASMLA
mgnify:CR=1 FL=1